MGKWYTKDENGNLVEIPELEKIQNEVYERNQKNSDSFQENLNYNFMFDVIEKLFSYVSTASNLYVVLKSDIEKEEKNLKSLLFDLVNTRLAYLKKEIDIEQTLNGYQCIRDRAEAIFDKYERLIADLDKKEKK